jgi:hypothetical protein
MDSSKYDGNINLDEFPKVSGLTSLEHLIVSIQMNLEY